MTRVDRRQPRAQLSVQTLPSVSVIVPFHDNLHQLRRCLAAMMPLPPHAEILVAADRAPRETERVASRHEARVIRVDGGTGPAAARNQAALASGSDVLIFIDADVVVPSAVLHAMVREFAANPTAAAIFGTYDDEPACPNFFSQYKNLSHAFVHRSARRHTRSFWAGFGGMRASVFRAIGGFDERFARPCIEDIELGDRASAAGHRILIDRRLHACHLKRWTFRSMLASDIWDRGVPWTRLVLATGRSQGLNLGMSAVASVALSYAALLLLGLALWWPAAPLAAAAAIAAVIALNRQLLRFLYHRRGASFAVRSAAINLLSHYYNGFSLVIGAAAHFNHRRAPVTSTRAAADSSARMAIR